MCMKMKILNRNTFMLKFKTIFFRVRDEFGNSSIISFERRFIAKFGSKSGSK